MPGLAGLCIWTLTSEISCGSRDLTITIFTWPNWSPPMYFRQTPGGHDSVPIEYKTACNVLIWIQRLVWILFFSVSKLTFWLECINKCFARRERGCCNANRKCTISKAKQRWAVTSVDKERMLNAPVVAITPGCWHAAKIPPEWWQYFYFHGIAVICNWIQVNWMTEGVIAPSHVRNRIVRSCAAWCGDK